MLAWKEILRPGDLFLDVGANIGSYSIWAAELGAKVIALEPAPDTFALLEENIALNKYPITPIQAAAGAMCGIARFTSGHDSTNHFARDGEDEITVLTVDSLIGDQTLAGMKIDVEGFEIEVLYGCERALSEHRVRLIQLEWNEESLAAVSADRKPIAELLTKYGYRLLRPNPVGKLRPLSDVAFGPDVFASILGSPEV
jgi:FkbM family methyltransferase